MRKFHLAASAAVLLLASAALSAQQATAPASLDSAVQAKIQSWRSAGNSGDIGIFAKNLDTGATYAYRADVPTPTASTIKLPVMIEAFYEADAGKLDWNKMIRLNNADKISGSGILQDLSDGDQFPLRDLMHLMIELSDNTGTDLVLTQVNGNAVNARMASLGLLHTALMRGVLNNHTLPAPGTVPAAGTPPPFAQTTEGAKPENAVYGLGRSCPRDMVTLLDLLYHDKLVNKAASEEMLRVLKHQFYHYAGRELAETDIASKSGALDHFRSDVALIYTKHGAIAMTITVTNIPQVNYSDSNPGVEIISDLSEVLISGLATPAK